LQGRIVLIVDAAIAAFNLAGGVVSTPTLPTNLT
jgi:hypothetical protein